MLSELVKEKVLTQGISIREASRQIGVSHMTINRIMKGGNVDVGTTETIAKWLGVSLSVALGIDHNNDDLVNTILSVISTEPKLADLFKRAADDLKREKITKEDFRDIVEYASFKLGRRIDDDKATIHEGDR